MGDGNKNKSAIDILRFFCLQNILSYATIKIGLIIKEFVMSLVSLRAIKKEEVVVGGKKYICYVMSKHFEPMLPFFVGHTQKGEIFFSEQIPDEFRNLVISHEIHRHILNDKENKSTKDELTKKEFSSLVCEDRERYFWIRHVFYSNLLTFLTCTPWSENANALMIEKIKATLAVLDEVRSVKFCIDFLETDK